MFTAILNDFKEKNIMEKNSLQYYFKIFFSKNINDFEKLKKKKKTIKEISFS